MLEYENPTALLGVEVYRVVATGLLASWRVHPFTIRGILLRHEQTPLFLRNPHDNYSYGVVLEDLYHTKDEAVATLAVAIQTEANKLINTI